MRDVEVTVIVAMCSIREILLSSAQSLAGFTPVGMKVTFVKSYCKTRNIYNICILISIVYVFYLFQKFVEVNEIAGLKDCRYQRQ